LREREGESRGRCRGMREREKEEADSLLSAEPDAGLDLTTLRS